MGPRLSAGKKVRALRMRITLISSTVNSAVFTGKVPGEGGTLFLLARLPASASTGMIMRNRPPSMVKPSITLYHQVLALSPANAEPLLAAAEVKAEEHTSELQSLRHLVCRLLLEK